MSQSVSRNFPGFFVIFGVFFVPLKQFLQFMELFLALKKLKKNYSIGLGRACGLTQPARADSAGQARQGPSAEAGHGRRRRRSVDLGVRASPASAPINARPGPLARAPAPPPCAP
jgi:hypothetical protein